MATGLEDESTDVLLTIEANLLRGLELVAASLDDGTFDVAREKGSAPPSEGGQITLGMLRTVRAELASRV
jgi:hypothetical protein